MDPFTKSALQYIRDHPELGVWDIAFKIEFQDPVNFLTGLTDRLKEVASDSSFYNYLAFVQSSGYGKTRSICELASKIPLIYVCFRSTGSTSYPPATLMSNIILYELDLFSKPADLLSNKNLAADFWDDVYVNKKKIAESQISGEKLGLSANERKIHILFDEASVLFDKTNTEEEDIPFRAVRQALMDNGFYVVGILTDTNSIIVNLAPRKEIDPSAREYNFQMHKPFIYIATTDCLRNVNRIPQIEHVSGYDIIRFGRPLWSSYWLAAFEDTYKFGTVVQLAIHKLLGGASAWSQIKIDNIKRTAALTLIGCTADLSVSPTSSEASDLVKAHMGTLVAIDKERKRHLVTYPSEPVLSEAALEVLSMENSELEVLRELDETFNFGGILEVGCQGELVKRVSFSVRRPVLDFLDELIVNFPREKFSQLEGFRIGFSHFISLNYEPDKETWEGIWSQRGAIFFKHNQKDADLAIPIICESNNALSALILQIGNHISAKQNRFEGTDAVETLLLPEVMFADDCYADIEKNYLGSAYEDGSGITVRNYENRKLLEEFDSGNCLIIHGLNAFKLDDNHKSIFKNLLRSWNDSSRLCDTDMEREYLYQLLPCVYSGFC
ncbi:6015_t:CDS:10 [Ambispora gerdemannii]|uniref:6015_t:CDS:1 n=1 Tax=Ambispora gerdemannii TaxID=144530 RepID=A0A9N9ADU2_9GLOM|nr:6015_t:CDS:10 [Ambispora gerdemannii]